MKIGYLFYQINGGTRAMNGLIRRRLFKITTKEAGIKGYPLFQMAAPGEASPHQVHFIGDERLSVDKPHGKSKKQDTRYNRTAPSLIRELELGTKKPFD